MKKESIDEFLKGTSYSSYSLHDYITSMLDGADYGRGKFETLEATVDNQSTFLANLTEKLIEKEILTISEDLDSLTKGIW